MTSKRLIPSYRWNVIPLLNRLFMPIVALLILGGCASKSPLPPTLERADQTIYKKKAAYNRPYKVRGKTYYPLDSAIGYRERGVASWYGAESGDRTAMGMPFVPSLVSAAHKTLPLPCKVRVTNLRNGLAIDVVVNDRGPFRRDRLIDLSQGAAKMLGMRGNTEVEVEYIGGAVENF